MKKILVIEDEVKLATHLSRALEAEGHEARVVHDGKVALKDRTTGELVKDSKETVRTPSEVISEKFKNTEGWLKVAEPAPADPSKKTTFSTKVTGTGKKFADNNAILAEVEKQLGTTKGDAARKLYTQLVAENK